MVLSDLATGENRFAFQDEVLEGRTKHKLPFSKVFERKDPELLKFDVIIFAASPDANKRWICDDEGISSYKHPLL